MRVYQEEEESSENESVGPYDERTEHPTVYLIPPSATVPRREVLGQTNEDDNSSSESEGDEDSDMEDSSSSEEGNNDEREPMEINEDSDQQEQSCSCSECCSESDSESDSSDSEDNNAPEVNENADGNQMDISVTSPEMPLSNVSALASCSRKLTFEVVKSDGGVYGSQFDVKNILTNDRKVFCSVKSSNVHILLKFTHSYFSSGAFFTLNEFILKAPAEKEYSAPCRDGMIFVSDHEINFEDVKYFDDFTKEKYEQWLSRKRNRKSHGTSENEPKLEPVAFFKLSSGSNYTARYRFTPGKDSTIPHGKYLLLKLIRPNVTSTFIPVHNIDLQYAGFRGICGKSCIAFGAIN